MYIRHPVLISGTQWLEPKRERICSDLWLQREKLREYSRRLRWLLGRTAVDRNLRTQVGIGNRYTVQGACDMCSSCPLRSRVLQFPTWRCQPGLSVQALCRWRTFQSYHSTLSFACGTVATVMRGQACSHWTVKGGLIILSK